MTRLRTLIVDDEPLARERIRSLLEARDDVEVIGECEDGRSAVAAVAELTPDLLLLDIQMPEMDGFEVLAELDEAMPSIIFITAYDKYAVQAFDVAAIDYLLKPVQPERFAKAVDRAIARAGTPHGETTAVLHALVERVERDRGERSRFVVRHGSRLFFVRAVDVDWIDGAANYVRLHVGGRIHFVRDTMKNVEARLDPDAFVRIHRSVIIRLDRVSSIEPTAHGEYLVLMQDGARLNASRTHSDRLRALLR